MSVTEEKKKDWSWRTLVVGYHRQNYRKGHNLKLNHSCCEVEFV